MYIYVFLGRGCPMCWWFNKGKSENSPVPTALQKFVEAGMQGEGAVLASCRVCGGQATFGSHRAAARHEPNTDLVSNSSRHFPGTAERITAAQTVKGNEERARRLEKMGRGMTHETAFLASPPLACSHGAVTHHHQRPRHPLGCWSCRQEMQHQRG